MTMLPRNQLSSRSFHRTQLPSQLQASQHPHPQGARDSALTGSPASPFSPGRPGFPRSPWNTEQIKVGGQFLCISNNLVERTPDFLPRKGLTDTPWTFRVLGVSGSFPITVACPGVCEVTCTFPPAAHQALCCPMLASLSLDLSLGHPPPCLLRVGLPGRGRGRLSSRGHVHVASWPWNLTFSGVVGNLHFAESYVLATRLTFRVSHAWPWATHWEPRPETVGGTWGPVVRPHPHTSPGPWHRPQGPCAWTLSPWVGAPSLSPHLVWMGAPWGFRTAGVPLRP